MSNRKPKRGGGHAFTNPDELMHQEAEAEAVAPPSSSDDDDEEEEEEEAEVIKHNGVSYLITTHNPNRTGKPANRDDAPLSRKERDSAMDPLALKPKMDLERDLVRLKLVRRRREPRDKKWEEEKKAREAAHAAAQARAQERLEALKNKGKGGRKPGAKVGKPRPPPKSSSASAAGGPEVPTPSPSIDATPDS
ncbi:hypothetical protein TcWFU_005580 [Taenia crassiceps]|uniref:Casein kinase substrate phosphoprotein PP28 domain-containing protein n=1 Tax=Taenia crassiceps TaxID=6207 RepID=A0ABR4QBZ8_9CEST